MANIFEENKRLWKMLEEAHSIILTQKGTIQLLQEKLDKKNALLSERNKKGA